MYQISEHTKSGKKRIRVMLSDFDWNYSTSVCDLADPLALDLIDIARGIHLADRALRRSRLLGSRMRAIELSVPVRNQRVWNDATEYIEGIASFVSADQWKISFRKHGSARRQLKSRLRHRFNVVALFSGGLDSLCGAAYQARQGNCPIFVTHSPPGRDRTRKLLANTFEAFVSGSDSFDTASFQLRPHEVGSSGTRSQFQEHSRRTRPLYFLALASAIALELDVRNVQMSENGALAQSLPFRRDAYGGTIARQAHPHMLQRFEELLRLIRPSGADWRVFNPLEEMTKGEACMLLGPASHLAVSAVSCEYIGKQAGVIRNWILSHPRHSRRLGSGPQCGACLPCIARRAALRRAKIADLDRDYFYTPQQIDSWNERVPVGKHPNRLRLPLADQLAGHVFHQRAFCKQLLKIGLGEFSVRFLPELRLAVDPGGNLYLDPSRRFQLMRRYAREILGFLDGSAD